VRDLLLVSLFCGFLRMISLVSMTVPLVTLVCTGGLINPAVKPVSCRIGTVHNKELLYYLSSALGALPVTRMSVGVTRMRYGNHHYKGAIEILNKNREPHV
jgi:hypothetical protein